MPTPRTFSDIDFNLEVHPSTGDVLKVYDANAVKASVKHLVLTEFYGRPFHPEIGSSVAGLLFENWSPLIDEAIRTTIRDVIRNFEPRASVEDVRSDFNEANNSLSVEVDIYMQALMQAATVDLILKRIR